MMVDMFMKSTTLDAKLTFSVEVYNRIFIRVSVWVVDEHDTIVHDAFLSLLISNDISFVH